MAPRSPPLNYVSATGTFMVRNGEYIDAYTMGAANPNIVFCPSVDFPRYPSMLPSLHSIRISPKCIVLMYLKLDMKLKSLGRRWRR